MTLQFRRTRQRLNCNGPDAFGYCSWYPRNVRGPTWVEASASGSSILTPINAPNARVFPGPSLVLQASVDGDDAEVDVAPAAQVVVYPRGNGLQDKRLGFFFSQVLTVAPLIHDAQNGAWCVVHGA